MHDLSGTNRSNVPNWVGPCVEATERYGAPCLSRIAPSDGPTCLIEEELDVHNGLDPGVERIARPIPDSVRQDQESAGAIVIIDHLDVSPKFGAGLDPANLSQPNLPHSTSQPDSRMRPARAAVRERWTLAHRALLAHLAER